MKTVNECRSCSSNSLEVIFSKPESPVAGRFLKKEELDKEQLYPLTLCICDNCGLVQITEEVDSQELFRDYRYLSSISGTGRKHFEDFASWLKNYFGPRFFYVEVGANDGVLLKPLVDKYGFSVVGVDPAENIETPQGVVILRDFFSKSFAEKLKPSLMAMPVIVVGSNVFAHIPTIHDILDGIEILIEDGGYFVMEVNYALDVLNHGMFDSVYHEHFFYWSVSSLEHILCSHGMYINHVEWLPMHQSTIRVVASRIKNSPIFNNNSVEKYKAIEKYSKLSQYYSWVDAFAKYKKMLLELMIQAEKYRGVCAYGAAGRATMFFDDFKFKKIDFVIDESKERVGRYVPKSHYPIVLPIELYTNPTQACIISAWTYESEIRNKEKFYRGKWLVPFQEFR
jgi:hypothetical protein